MKLIISEKQYNSTIKNLLILEKENKKDGNLSKLKKKVGGAFDELTGKNDPDFAEEDYKEVLSRIKRTLDDGSIKFNLDDGEISFKVIDTENNKYILDVLDFNINNEKYKKFFVNNECDVQWSYEEDDEENNEDDEETCDRKSFVINLGYSYFDHIYSKDKKLRYKIKLYSAIDDKVEKYLWLTDIINFGPVNMSNYEEPVDDEKSKDEEPVDDDKSKDEEENYEEKRDEILHYLMQDKTLKDAFYKKPSFVKSIFGAKPKGILVAQNILNKYFNKQDLGKYKHRVGSEFYVMFDKDINKNNIEFTKNKNYIFKFIKPGKKSHVGNKYIGKDNNGNDIIISITKKIKTNSFENDKYEIEMMIKDKKNTLIKKVIADIKLIFN